MGRRKMSMKRGKSLGSEAEPVSGRTLLTLTVGNGVQAISPALYPRALQMADVFNFYRFTKFKASIIPTGAQAALGFVGGVMDNPPTTLAQMIELPYAVLHGASKTSNTTLDVPRKELLSNVPLKWFKTIASSLTASFEDQGYIYYITTSTVLIVVEWTIEFQSWNLAANSPLKIVPGIKNDNSALKPKSWYEKTDDVIVVGGVTYRKSEVVPSPPALTGAC